MSSSKKVAKKRKDEVKKVFDEQVTAVFNTSDNTKVLLTFQGSDGMSRTKQVSISAFLSVMGDVVSVGDEISLNNLPSGFYKGKLNGVSGGTMDMLIVVPADLRAIMYDGKVFTVPFPDLLFHFEVRTGRVVSSEVFAMKTSFPKEDTCLYEYPFGNVYHDARICWGNMILPMIERPKELESVISMFFSSETNNDLFDRKAFKGASQGEVLKMLEKKKLFPSKSYVPNGNGDTTVGDVLKRTENLD